MEVSSAGIRPIVEDFGIRSRLHSWEVRTCGRSAAGGTLVLGPGKMGLRVRWDPSEG